MEDIYCIGTKKDGARCGYKKKYGDYCGFHIPKEEKEVKVKKEKVKRKDKNDKNDESRLAITITYSEMVENHVGMEKLGKNETEGFDLNDLSEAKLKFEKLGAICELHNLNEALNETEYAGKAEEAYLLVIRNGANILLHDIKKSSENMMKELTVFPWDVKALMKGKVVNKHARENVCFADKPQESDIPNGKGTVISFNSVPCTEAIRNKLETFLGLKANNLLAEGNKYKDVKNNGIGYHGDSERVRVIAVRLGQEFPLHYQWFLKFNPVGNRIILNFNDGDIYIMSSKAVGTDWKKSSKLTLRHAAGADKYITIKKK